MAPSPNTITAHRHSGVIKVFLSPHKYKGSNCQLSVRLLCFNSANKKLKLHTTPCKIAKKQSTINTITAHRHRESAHEAPRNRDFGKFPISHPCPIAQIEALPPAQLFHTPHGTAPAEHKATASDAHVNDKHRKLHAALRPRRPGPRRRGSAARTSCSGL